MLEDVSKIISNLNYDDSQLKIRTEGGKKMEGTKDLVIFYIYEDEAGYFEKSIYENVIDLKRIENMVTEEETLVYTLADGYSDEIALDDVEIHRYVSHDSHLSKYVRNNEKYECEWDEEGNIISKKGQEEGKKID